MVRHGVSLQISLHTGDDLAITLSCRKSRENRQHFLAFSVRPFVGESVPCMHGDVIPAASDPLKPQILAREQTKAVKFSPGCLF